MATISELGRMFGLSRSTLLYYDSIGLLAPDGRTGSNYRIYSQRQVERLGKISELRQTGLPLAQIKELLDGRESRVEQILKERLALLNKEIQNLRKQQRTIVELLENDDFRGDTRCMDKERWMSILRACGMTNRDMHEWHRHFERQAPEAHRDFLESLGLDETEIRSIRKQSASHRR